jgi:hypothetical protein
MRTRSSCRVVAVFLFLALSAAQGPCAPGMSVPASALALPENWQARALLRETIFASVGDAAAHRSVVIEQSEGVPRVSFQTQKQSGFLYLVFANPAGRDYPLDAAGTFIIKRSMKDGSFVQAKVFLQDDPGCYLRLFPQDDRTLMDIYLFGEPFQAQLYLPVPFDRLLTASIAHIMELSSAAVDWPSVLAPAQGPGDQRLSRIVATLRARLSGLRDMDDGAMDRDGRMVFIATGAPAPAGKGGFNCSGFAKWVVDGFYAPLTGKESDIAALKSRDSMREGRWSARYEEELDPYFGLDWTRGLARSIARARTGTLPDDEEVDVRDAAHVPYIKDVGYPVPSLQVVLYFLARKNPGTIYLGSVNAPSLEASQEGTPTLRQHHHVIVLFPFFDPRGAFRVVVMERNLETSLASLDRRYALEYVHLVRLDSEGEFSLPRIE